MPGIGELMILMLFPMLGIWIWMIIDCALYEPPPHNTVWLLVTILTVVLGALIYLVIRRPQRIRQYGR